MEGGDLARPRRARRADPASLPDSSGAPSTQTILALPPPGVAGASVRPPPSVAPTVYGGVGGEVCLRESKKEAHMRRIGFIRTRAYQQRLLRCGTGMTGRVRLGSCDVRLDLMRGF